jgi:hypothetical protein
VGDLVVINVKDVRTGDVIVVNEESFVIVQTSSVVIGRETSTSLPILCLDQDGYTTLLYLEREGEVNLLPEQSRASRLDTYDTRCEDVACHEGEST